ncbi:MAG TPA: hypothetical protein VNB29_07565 [Chthoniobacterales bacterium]|nr:hypothetical protein [Chthoniobacterales bacterium]
MTGPTPTPEGSPPATVPEYVLVQAGQQFHCTSVIYTPSNRTLMTDLNPGATTVKPALVPAFITAKTDRPINTMAAVHLLATADTSIPLPFLRSQSGKAVTDQIRIDEPDASRVAGLWNLL